MKKIFYLASIAALAFSSCAKDETAEVTLGAVGSGEIVATVGDADTRAYLDANHKFNWQDGDKLAVYNDADHPMFNSAYSWKSGVATGVFVGEKKFNAEDNHLAVYPRFSESLIPSSNLWTNNTLVPGAAKGTKGSILTLDANDVAIGVKLSIPAEQKFQPGSFYQDVVPAMSTTFNVLEDGNAGITMQPVADYLFVNIKSTEPIETLTLKMIDGDNSSNWLTLAGQGSPTAYLLNGKVRYYLDSESLENGSETITLKTNDYAADVTCHEPQTYVFVIPGGILGSNEVNKNESKYGIEAWIWVNKTSSEITNENVDFISGVRKQTDKNGDVVVNNTQMNSYIDTKGTKKETDDELIIREADPEVDNADPNGILETKTMAMENMYFWMNPQVKNAAGEMERGSFVYNPDGAVIIEHEGQLLEYLTEYDNASSDLYMRDAFICSEYVFDFSLQNMRELTTELKANGSYNDYQVYISNYLADSGKFPCLDNYVNEFKGNGAVIKNIERPLEKTTGIFGNIRKSTDKDLVGIINNVTFSGIVAATNRYENYAETAYVYVPGYILGTLADNAALIDVTVEDAQGMAILNHANVDAYKNLTVKNAEGLNFIIADMDLEDGLEIKNWDAVKAAKMNVFGTLDASGHKVVKLPAGAVYGDLAQHIGTTLANDANADWDDDSTNDKNAWYIRVIYQLLGYPANYYAPIEAVQSDNNVVSVLIGEDSYWTGDKTNWSMDLPKKVGGTGAGYYKLEYAEQLAMGADADNSARVMRNMHLESAVNLWEMVTVKHLDGNNKTISGVRMNGLGLETVAPVDAEVLTNLTVDGVTLDLKTKIDGTSTYTVPTTISGLAVDAKTITNVTVNNLVIDAYAYDGTNNTEAYYGNTTSTIGWMVAKGTDTYITDSKVNGVNSNVRGLAGLVGEMTLINGAQIKNSAATNVTKAQADITDFAQFEESSHKNLAGTAVAVVKNAQSNPKDIKFVGIGKPAFLYDSTKGITVVYDSVESKTYKNR